MKKRTLLLVLAFVLTAGAFAQTEENTYMEAVRQYYAVRERKTALDADIDSLMALFERVKAANANYREECEFYMEKISKWYSKKISKWYSKEDSLRVVSVKTRKRLAETLMKLTAKNKIDSEYIDVPQNADGTYSVRRRTTYYVVLNTAYESAVSDASWIQVNEKVGDNFLAFSVPATSYETEPIGVLVISKGSQKLQLKFKMRTPQTTTAIQKNNQ